MTHANTTKGLKVGRREFRQEVATGVSSMTLNGLIPSWLSKCADEEVNRNSVFEERITGKAEVM